MTLSGIEDSRAVRIGVWLMVARSLSKQTQVELAAEMGTSATYISHLERGRHVPSLRILGFYRSLLGVDLNHLVDDCLVSPDEP